MVLNDDALRNYFETFNSKGHNPLSPAIPILSPKYNALNHLAQKAIFSQ